MPVRIIFLKGKYQIDQHLQEIDESRSPWHHRGFMTLCFEALIDGCSVKKEEFFKQYKKDYPGRLPKGLRKLI